MRRGEVYWAVLAPRSGSEQQGRRPVIIVSRNAFNRAPNWRSVVVIPIPTSSAQAVRGPTAVLLPAKAAGLKKISIALCHQVTTLDRAKLEKRIGVLSQDVMQKVDSGIKAALDLVLQALRSHIWLRLSVVKAVCAKLSECLNLKKQNLSSPTTTR